MISKIHIIILLCLLSSCGGSSGPDWWCEDCNDDIDDLIGNMGEAEWVETYTPNDTGYNIWTSTYWYWSKGISYTFNQNRCVCEKSTYEFTPILNAPEEIVWEPQSNPFNGQGSYSIAFSEGVLMVRLKLKLVGDPVSEELRERYEKGIEDAWSTTRFEVPIVIDVVWTDDDPDKTIQVVFGTGRWNTSKWHTAGWVEETVAHEAGHYFGLYDEYGGGDAQGFDGGAAPGPRPWHPPGLMANHNMPMLDYYYDGFLDWYDKIK